MSGLALKIVTPDGAREPVDCDSIHLQVRDGVDGKNGGNYGIRPGHSPALFSLEDGSIQAFQQGREVFAAACGCGFATVDGRTVTVIAEAYTEQAVSPGKPMA